MLEPVFEAEITPGMHADDAVRLGRAVEQAGFHRLGLSCVALWQDTYQLQALIAAATERIQIGAIVTNPYTRHVSVHAAALATLQEVSKGRAFAGFGVGAGLEPFDINYPRPVSTLRETITVLRALLNGDEVVYDGQHITVHGARLDRPPTVPVPIAIGTRSPRMMRLAGELADRVLVGARYLTPDLTATYRAWLAEGSAVAGREAKTIEMMARVTLCISDDGQLAINSVKRFAAHYLEILGDAGPPIEADRRDLILKSLRRAEGWYFDLNRYDPPEMLELIDDELARAFAVVGTPAQCAEQIRAILDMGFAGVSCNLAAVNRESMYSGLSESVTGAAKMLTML